MIGEVKAFSGFMEIFDQPPLRAAEFAVADINAAGGILGRPVELITGDYATKIEDVVPAAQDLLDQGADFLIVACDFDFGALPHHWPQRATFSRFLTAPARSSSVPQGIGPLAYTMGASCRTEGAIGAEFANEDKGATRAFVLRDPSFLYYDECTTGFKDRFTELGWRNCRRRDLPSGRPDYRNPASRPSSGFASSRRHRAVWHPHRRSRGNATATRRWIRPADCLLTLIRFDGLGRGRSRPLRPLLHGPGRDGRK